MKPTEITAHRQGVSEVQKFEGKLVSLLEKKGDSAAWLTILTSGSELGMDSQYFSGGGGFLTKFPL